MIIIPNYIQFIKRIFFFKKKDNYSYHYYREITQIMNYILDNCNKIYLKKPLIHYI